jgi:hypothetical protein
MLPRALFLGWVTYREHPDRKQYFLGPWLKVFFIIQFFINLVNITKRVIRFANHPFSVPLHSLFIIHYSFSHLSPQSNFLSGMKWNIIVVWWDEVGKSLHTNKHTRIRNCGPRVRHSSAHFVDIKRLLLNIYAYR